ncbi:MAG: T9SS type A sorting domain-containing protein, partial [Chitinophagaceae bacterium]
AGNAYRLMVRGDRSIDLNTQPVNTTATTLRATGTLLTGAVTLSNSASTPSSLPTLASNASAFSLVANPYASSIDWNALGKTGLTGYYYIWDPTLGTRGAYVSCFTDGTKSNGSSNITTAIQSGQAFFVQNTSASEARQLTINEAHKTTGNTNVFRMQSGTATMGIQLYLTANINGASQDGATILFNNNHSNLVNDDDANKFANLDENIAIQKGNTLMSIERRNIPATTDTIHLKAWQLMQSNYTLRIASANFNGTVKAYLLDKFLNTETLLNLNGTTDVNFSTKSTTASIASDRFSIVFREVSLLPVSITNVSASQKNAGIEIIWNTANETNMSSYEVEKSIDGNSFSKATTVAAKNVSVSTNNYSWYDAQVNQGNNYYRIKAVEKNGKYQYTQIVKVYIGSKAPSFTVYPNPVIGKTVRLQLSNVEMGVYTVRIFNSLGQEVASQSINHNGGSIIETIPLGKIAAGNYSMQIMNGTKTVITKTIMVE